jgi:hypothetical protein
MAILNIKDFPDDLHRKAKSEAALVGISLKELIIRALTDTLDKKEGSDVNEVYKEKRPKISRRLL